MEVFEKLPSYNVWSYWFSCFSFTNDVVVPCQCRHCPISYRDLYFGGNWKCSKEGSWRRRDCQVPGPFHQRDLVQFQCCRYLADRQICSVQSRLVDNFYYSLVYSYWRTMTKATDRRHGIQLSRQRHSLSTKETPSTTSDQDLHNNRHCQANSDRYPISRTGQPKSLNSRPGTRLYH